MHDLPISGRYFQWPAFVQDLFLKVRLLIIHRFWVENRRARFAHCCHDLAELSHCSFMFVSRVRVARHFFYFVGEHGLIVNASKHVDFSLKLHRPLRA